MYYGSIIPHVFTEADRQAAILRSLALDDSELLKARLPRYMLALHEACISSLLRVMNRLGLEEDQVAKEESSFAVFLEEDQLCILESLDEVYQEVSKATRGGLGYLDKLSMRIFRVYPRSQQWSERMNKQAWLEAMIAENPAYEPLKDHLFGHSPTYWGRIIPEVFTERERQAAIGRSLLMNPSGANQPLSECSALCQSPLPGWVFACLEDEAISALLRLMDRLGLSEDQLIRTGRSFSVNLEEDQWTLLCRQRDVFVECGPETPMPALEGGQDPADPKPVESRHYFMDVLAKVPFQVMKKERWS